MPRDSNGTYSLPAGTIVTTGETITVSQHNPAMNDIASSITQSLSRGGNGGMLAPLSMNGYPIRNVARGTLEDDVATVGQLSSNGAPVGSVIMYAGVLPPVGWLVCNGSAVSRSAYPDLFSAIGSTFGGGDGSTTFNLPDLRGRVAVGSDAQVNGAYADRIPPSVTDVRGVGKSGGTSTVSLTVDQIPSHSHASTATIPNHNHQWHASGTGPQAIDATTSGGGASSFSSTGGVAGFNSDPVSGAYYTGAQRNLTGTQAVTLNNASAGGGQAHINVQPVIALHYIIKARAV